jgi:DedD protein
MERSLKERLIGATVLVALAVWFIPWALNGPVSIVDSESAAELTLPVVQSSGEIRTQVISLEGRRDPPIPSSVNGIVTENNQVAEPISINITPQSESQISAQNVSQEEVETLIAQEQPVSQVLGEVMWVVQVGSFGESENAQRLAERVAAVGFNASVSAFSTSDRTMFRVRVGPASARVDAETVASSLGIHGFVAQVVSQD